MTAAIKVGAPALLGGEFRSAAHGQLAASVDGETLTYPLDTTVRLFRALEGASLGASELTLVAGERVRFVVDGGQVTFLEAEQSRLGPSADHSSRYYRWEVRMTRDEVARSISPYGSVGVVRDIVPRRLGVSGRVVEGAVVGSQGELVLRHNHFHFAIVVVSDGDAVDRSRVERVANVLCRIVIVLDDIDLLCLATNILTK